MLDSPSTAVKHFFKFCIITLTLRQNDASKTNDINIIIILLK